MPVAPTTVVLHVPLAAHAANWSLTAPHGPPPGEIVSGSQTLDLALHVRSPS
jgi:hypothetical protein